jgi:hypothetical protein
VLVAPSLTTCAFSERAAIATARIIGNGFMMSLPSRLR